MIKDECFRGFKTLLHFRFIRPKQPVAKAYLAVGFALLDLLGCMPGACTKDSVNNVFHMIIPSSSSSSIYYYSVVSSSSFLLFIIN